MPVGEIIRSGSNRRGAGDRHRHGVVHRDLKPRNVMLTKSGAKLLVSDWRKEANSARESESSAPSATEQKPLTAEGTVVGTYQYMSPEQFGDAVVSHRYFLPRRCAVRDGDRPQSLSGKSRPACWPRSWPASRFRRRRSAGDSRSAGTVVGWCLRRTAMREFSRRMM